MSRARSRIGRAAVLRLAIATLLTACSPPPEQSVPRSTIFIGIDVSGSFQSQGRYDDALAFAARYIHAHLNGYGGLEVPRALFVGSIGGDAPGQPQAFHPIHDFENKSVAEIERDLRTWFPVVRDHYTDFSAFFERAADLAKRQNLVLAPITLVLFTDGVPDLGARRLAAAAAAPASSELALQGYRGINLEPLEYIARSVTVRVLYPDPPVAVRWERHVPRTRVRMWTTDRVVMAGWREQLDPAGGPEAQPNLWRWIQENVDFRVRRSIL